jgi:hypothetical protein
MSKSSHPLTWRTLSKTGLDSRNSAFVLRATLVWLPLILPISIMGMHILGGGWT